MARTITALFDTREDADAGSARLHEAGVDANHVHVHDQTTHKTSGDYSTHEDRGLWASIKNAFLPDDDRQSYEEGIRRGGFLLTADIDDDKTAEAVAALEYANAIDLDERTQQWQSQGWLRPTSALGEADTLDVYGQRDVDQGGTRVRSYSRSTSMDRGI